MAVLDDIIVGVRADLAERKQRTSIAELERAISVRPPALDAGAALRAAPFALIAEVKRASPSKGALAEIPAPAELAETYVAGGAAAISVLTEQRRFGGTLADLDAVRETVAVPVLRKDFMVDEYQFLEARAHGADLVLLIVAALTDAELTRFAALARELAMTCLVETHTPDEVRRAVDLGAAVIGVNNRNLKTLDVDLARFEELATLIPAGCVRIAESGIGGPADVVRLADAGADGILVGETLVRSGDPTVAARELIAAGTR